MYKEFDVKASALNSVGVMRSRRLNELKRDVEAVLQAERALAAVPKRVSSVEKFMDVWREHARMVPVLRAFYHAARIRETAHMAIGLRHGAIRRVIDHVKSLFNTECGNVVVALGNWKAPAGRPHFRGHAPVPHKAFRKALSEIPKVTIASTCEMYAACSNVVVDIVVVVVVVVVVGDFDGAMIGACVCACVLFTATPRSGVPAVRS